jgi:3'(2'), 5'-bisphosphate nucleotidase
LATATGDVLLGVRRTPGANPTELAHRGDVTANEFLVAALRRHRPTDAIRSEEQPDDHRVGTATRLWIIDPLDGSREFAEPGRVDWAVHVALIVDGNVRAGAVALPARRRTWSTAAAPPTRPARTRPPRIVVSRTRPASEADAVAAAIGGQLSTMGSAGAKTVAVLERVADVYLHSGGQFEWDVAAPAAIAIAAGLHVSRLDGSPLRFDQPDPWLPDFLVCTPDLATPIIAAVLAARR